MPTFDQYYNKKEETQEWAAKKKNDGRKKGNSILCVCSRIAKDFINRQVSSHFQSFAFYSYIPPKMWNLNCRIVCMKCVQLSEWMFSVVRICCFSSRKRAFFDAMSVWINRLAEWCGIQWKWNDERQQETKRTKLHLCGWFSVGLIVYCAALARYLLFQFHLRSYFHTCLMFEWSMFIQSTDLLDKYHHKPYNIFNAIKRAHSTN